MSRIRTVKPNHWTDKELPNISLQAHLLWIGCWNFSDDDGVFEADPLLLKAQIFPRRTDVRVEQVSQWLGQLVKARYIIPFTFNGESYYINRTFKTHQRIDKPQAGFIPSDFLTGVFQEHSKNDLGTLPPVKDSNGNSIVKGEDGKGAPAKKVKLIFSEFVTMTEEEHLKLLKKLGEEKTKRAIDILDNYKGSKNVKYDNDYRAILSWVIKRMEEEDLKINNNGQRHTTNSGGIKSTSLAQPSTDFSSKF